MDYTLGFAFDQAGRVLLIEKENKFSTPNTKPQKTLNGIGGKIHEGYGERPKQCMVREFKEETGIVTSIDNWVQRLKIVVGFSDIYVFLHNLPINAPTKESDEGKLFFVDPLCLPPNVLSDLRWILPMITDISINTDDNAIIKH